MPEKIRLGDPTSHGGKVLEGSGTDICHGKPIAYIGYMVSGPKCRGTYPIVEGVQTAGLRTRFGISIPTFWSDLRKARKIRLFPIA